MEQLWCPIWHAAVFSCKVLQIRTVPFFTHWQHSHHCSNALTHSICCLLRQIYNYHQPQSTVSQSTECKQMSKQMGTLCNFYMLGCIDSTHSFLVLPTFTKHCTNKDKLFFITTRIVKQCYATKHNHLPLVLCNKAAFTETRIRVSVCWS